MDTSPKSFDTEFPGLAASLASAYRIERELGRGGMGVVFLARDERLDRPVALKVLPPAIATQPTVRQRFLREARTAAQLAHPNIVPIYAADESGGFAYFVMAYIDGETLGQRVAALGRLEPAEVVRLLRDAAWALAYAHARGLVHRDVKPDNLMVERNTGRLVVTDFGIAHAPDSSPLTQAGLVMGSVHFMSPEQGAGDALDGRSDLYALGTVGFLLLSGQLPFEHDQASAVLVQRATRDAPPLRSVAPDVPPSIAAVIDGCLERDPDKRPPTGEALAELLERAWQQDAAALDANSSREQPPLSEDEAHRVWQRAAQLQAQAASRLESRTREQWALGGGRAGASSGSPAGNDPSGRGESAGGAIARHQPDAPPHAAAPDSSAFPVARVQAAAEEAGISRQYVAVALAELRAGREAGTALVTRTTGGEVAARVVLGPSPRAISVSRVFDHSPREVLAAMGIALQRPPCGLRLRETLGGHALYGGTLVFDLPVAEQVAGTGGMALTYGNFAWNRVRYQLWVKTLRAQLASAPGTSGQCEVTFTIEPPEGHAGSLGVAAALGGGGGMFGGLLGAVLVKKAVLVTLLGLPAALPLLGAGIVVGAFGHRLFYQHALRGAREELNKALDEVGRELMMEHMLGDPFGDPLVRKLPPR
ncbi:MAG: serine/threonine protein kinase [Gemmatimonadetes bacterium]|nr:serine/threonine protein kinase [Gemmatimonadota bacterium]